MGMLYDALDKIGAVPWQINVVVFELIKHVWKVGGGVAEIPYRIDKYKVSEDEIKRAKGKKKAELKKKLKAHRENFGLKCEFLLRMNIANEFARCEEIYFPYNADFRGRAYPLAPNLNHMGPDICRGLLTFARKKPLGLRGLYWLKINLANHMGKDKLSLEERVEYIDDNISWIYNCGKNPFEHTEWLESEAPWQTLANMVELANALDVVLAYL